MVFYQKHFTALTTSLRDWQPADSREIHHALSSVLGLMQIRQKSKHHVSSFSRNREKLQVVLMEMRGIIFGVLSQADIHKTTIQGCFCQGCHLNMLLCLRAASEHSGLNICLQNVSQPLAFFYQLLRSHVPLLHARRWTSEYFNR